MADTKVSDLIVPIQMVLDSIPRVNKYHSSKIYRIGCEHCGLFYIGSTIEQYLSIRLSKHKSASLKGSNCPMHRHFNSAGWQNAKIVLIENFRCEDISQLRAREEQYIKAYKPALNTYSASASSKNAAGMISRQYINRSEEHTSELQSH